MKIEIRETKKDGLIQITTCDERWYQRLEDNKFFPSVTWIASSYPKGKQFWKWLADKGWDESQAIKVAAGIKGYKIHSGIELLTRGQTIQFNDPLLNTETGLPEEVTVDEWTALMSFVDWWNVTKPTLIATEEAYYNDEVGYAGTVDMRVLIDGEPWVIDLKSGQTVWPEYELQLSAYRYFPECKDHKTAILQVGYRANKRGWKFTEVEDKFGLFLAAYAIWENENPAAKPKQKDVPKSLSINLEETK